jgi:transcription elongation factor GreA
MAHAAPVAHPDAMKSREPIEPVAVRRPIVSLPPARVPQLLMTAAEHAAHGQELARLRAIRDRELPAQLREARTYVTADAVEQILQIQEERTVMDARIASLEDLLSTATIIRDERVVDVVSLGLLVEVVYLRTGRRATYRLTGTGARADLASVSARSPVGQALMGRRAGDVVCANLPGGRVEELQIVTITATLQQVA